MNTKERESSRGRKKICDFPYNDITFPYFDTTNNTKELNPKKCLYTTTKKTQNPYYPTAHIEAQTSSQPIVSSNGVGALSKPNFAPWIFDCGGTDTMTFDFSDLLSNVPTNRTHIQTANGECIRVTQARTIDISFPIHLKNCLLVPSLSHKLLSIS